MNSLTPKAVFSSGVTVELGKNNEGELVLKLSHAQLFPEPVLIPATVEDIRRLMNICDAGIRLKINSNA